MRTEARSVFFQHSSPRTQSSGWYLVGAQYILMEGKKNLGGLLKVIKIVSDRGWKCGVSNPDKLCGPLSPFHTEASGS